MSALRPPSRFPRPAAFGVAALSLAAGAVVAAFACGPFFPSWMLGGGAPSEGPAALFSREVERLFPSGLAHSIVQPEGEGIEPMRQRTVQADGEDLAAALERAQMPAERRPPLLAAAAALRQALEAGSTAAGEAGSTAAEPGSAATVPAGLPAEFALYLEGALAYHREDGDAAVAAWEKLLALPAGERHFRSTWAAYMLGRIHDPDDEPGDDEEAIGWYHRTRELAAQGFADTLHLAAASLGWEARRAARRGAWAESLRLYAEAQRQGEPNALLSLRQTCRKALVAATTDTPGAAQDGAFADLAADPVARPIVTTYLLAAWPGEPAGPAAMKAWLAAVQKAGVTGAPEAADLAWASYLAGDYTAADAWLKRAPAEAPMARWVRARLLERQGRIGEAAALLDGLSHDFPGPELTVEDADWLYDAGGSPAATRTRAAGEAGVAWLHQGRYASALERFLAGSYWFDAAYVAERVMTADELKAYVDVLREAPESPDGEGTAEEDEEPMAESGGLRPPELAAQRKNLRDLLGRRLVRAGRFAEAGPYLTEELAEPLADWAAAARRGAPPDTLFAGACAARHQGMELLGTEIGPDWFYYSGQLEIDYAPESRPPFLGPTTKERKRAAATAVHPDRRFHYRYLAARKARQAASRLPDGSEQKAIWLATAGTWLKYRDPAAALPYYHELARCCSKTEIGREARRSHWIPDTDACLEGGS